MSGDQKKAMIVAAIFAAIIVLFLMLGRGGSRVVQTASGDVNFGDVVMPGLTLPPRGTFGPVTLPTYQGGPTQFELEARGSCCMDCASPRPTTYAPSRGGMIVINQGSRGGVTHIHEAPKPKSGSSGAGFRGY